MPEIKMYEGGAYADERGRISFVNDFTFKEVKRCYHIMHPRTETIRAWQGHRIEQKCFFVPHGKFLLAWVYIDDWNAPSVHLKSSYRVL